MMGNVNRRRRGAVSVACVAVVGLLLAGCEGGSAGTGSPGVGTVAGAAAGAGAGRLLFGNSTTGMLIGAVLHRNSTRRPPSRIRL